MERARASRAFARLAERSGEPEPISLGLVLGAVSLAGGFLAIAFGWYHAGNTDEVWIQNQEILSGGFGGLALVVMGSALVVRDRSGRSQALLLEALQAMRVSGDDPAPLDVTAVPAADGPEANGPRPARRRVAARSGS